MNKKIDPFTRTPGIAGKAYIDNGIADEIIENFRSDDSAKYVYKITGLRGSGKSVEYSKVIRTLKEDKGWLVYPLSSSGDAVSTLISKLSMEKFINSKNITTAVSSSTSAKGNIAVVSGEESINVSRSYTENEHFYSEEATLTKMITIANEKKYKVLVGIDDISKTPEMVRLLSMIGSMQLEGLQIYLIVTGLSENIEDFSSEKNLTFFKRADSREIKGLNKFDIAYMYEKLLGIDSEEARRIESVSGEYAYAYQVLGSLYFSKKDDETLDDLIPDYERILFKDSYDLIWQSLTDGEKEVVRCLYKTKDGKAEDIKSQMKNAASYPVFRNRLINKHLVDGDSRGRLKIRLPRFDKFIEIWGND
ncbi:hypothetical protein SAMN04487770_12010 [Butyrivibrio sp. ob235]|uniref:hypothetical protein n=1 Tax=Butyrivibrio sp. ob235 TaxID=1761780 RepID=UPI0008B2EBF7|nr:hypothetical protein [Butyrivibrio sp. ob235]SEL89169.1 hypothetical protein SAMN04487770_12010 [Butyrivibrio sp. ob235]